MPFELISKNASRLLLVLNSMLTTAQLDSLKAMSGRKVYLFSMGTYRRLCPSAPDKGLKYCVWDRIPSSVLSELKAGQADLLLDTIETVFVPGRDHRADFAEIYAALHKLGISPRRVILSNSNIVAPKHHAALAAELGETEPLRVWSLDYAIAYSALELKKSQEAKLHCEGVSCNPILEAVQPLNLRPFLFLNRKIKTHRTSVLLALLALVGEDRALYSLLGSDGAMGRHQLDNNLRRSVNFFAARRGLYPNVDWQRVADKLAARFPITLSGAEILGDAWTALHSVDASVYAATLISLVGETVFTAGDNLLITEKTLKPMFESHPFIVIGDPGTLERLRMLGFRSFAPVIDESYDSIADPERRLMAIVAELRRIGGFGPDELLKVRRTLSTVVQHNFNHVRGGFASRFAELALDSFTEVARAGG